MFIATALSGCGQALQACVACIRPAQPGPPPLAEADDTQQILLEDEDARGETQTAFLDRLGLQEPLMPRDYLDMYAHGVVWARVEPPARRLTLLLAPEEFMLPPGAPDAVTPLTDVWLAAYPALAAGPGSAGLDGTPAASSPVANELTALKTALRTAAPEAEQARSTWLAVAQRAGHGATLEHVLAHVWQVTCALGGPPSINDSVVGKTACAMVLRRAWLAAAQGPPETASPSPTAQQAALAWDPLKRLASLGVAGSLASARGWNCKRAVDLVPVTSRYTQALPLSETRPSERRIGSASDVVCFMCGRVARDSPCSALCRQWEKQCIAVTH